MNYSEYQSLIDRHQIKLTQSPIGLNCDNCGHELIIQTECFITTASMFPRWHFIFPSNVRLETAFCAECKKYYEILWNPVTNKVWMPES